MRKLENLSYSHHKIVGGVVTFVKPRTWREVLLKHIYVFFILSPFFSPFFLLFFSFFFSFFSPFFLLFFSFFSPFFLLFFLPAFVSLFTILLRAGVKTPTDQMHVARRLGTHITRTQRVLVTLLLSTPKTLVFECPCAAQCVRGREEEVWEWLRQLWPWWL